MSVSLRQFINCIEKFSPSRLAFPGDFVGVQVGSRDEATQERFKTRKCAVALDVNPQVILKAAENGANVLVTYHGLLSNPVEAFTDALLNKIRLLLENRIVLYVVHTSWLSAECGINDTLAEILGLTVAEVFSVELEGKKVPLGRVCNFGGSESDNAGHEVKSSRLSDFIARISERLNLAETIYVGSLHAPVKRALILAGEYGRRDWLRLAESRGVDTYVTGSICRDIAMLSNELGLSYVYVNNHIVESLGMRRLMQLLSIDVPEIDFIFVESQYPWRRYVSSKYLPKREADTRGKT
nr:Nif3-like dinuclear metal center hexameric protein [Candidatus Njordarchaeota archaeon]